MIAGGIEAAITPFAVAGFNAMRALSTRNDEPERASRPFDRDRDGFVMGEGGGILILEELTLARRRGARIYAEICGYGCTADAYHMAAPPPGHEGAARSMEIALRSCGMEPSCDRLHQRPRHGNAAQRCLRDPGHQAGLRGAQPQARRLLHEVHDGAPAGRCGRARGHRGRQGDL